MRAKRRYFIFSHLFSSDCLFSSFCSTIYFRAVIIFVFTFFGVLSFFSADKLFGEDPFVPEKMMSITGGTFLMGQFNPHIGDRFLSSNEQPIHRSTLDNFYLSRYEFTLGEALELLSVSLEKGDLEIEKDTLYLKGEKDHPLLFFERSMLKDDSSSKRISLPQGFENHPLTGVTWYGALFLCNARSIKEKLTPAYNLKEWQFIEGSIGYRLPFEAEWEYAARNGEWSYRYNKKEKPVGANIADISFSQKESKHGYESGIDDGFPSLAPVGSFSPENQLYDMRGNVQEWCYDYYSECYFEEAVPRNNPSGPGEGVSRVCRGGDWQSLYRETRPTARTHWKPETGEMFLGFRMARSIIND